MPLIVFEGIDGSGTTTQSKRTAEFFEEAGRSVQWTCEPTDGPIGKLVREYFTGAHGKLPSWRTMYHLFQADREQHAERVGGWLAEGKYVVSDRYWLSSLTYQVVSAMRAGADERNVEDLIQRNCEHLPLPDVTIVLDVEVEEGLKRVGKEPDLYEKSDFLETVRARYLAVMGKQVRHVDTTGKTKDEVFKEIDEHLSSSGF